MGWPPDMRNWFSRKDSGAGEDWRQEKRMTEGEMVGWHHWLDGHEFEQALGAGDGQGSLHAAIHGVTKSQTWLNDWTELSDRFPLLGLQNHSGRWQQWWNQKTIASWQESDDKPRQRVEKQRRHSANKGLHSQGYDLPSGHVLLWELNSKEGRMPKNWCLWTGVLEKTPESPLDSKDIKPVYHKRY